MKLGPKPFTCFREGHSLIPRYIRLTRPLDSQAGLPHQSYEGVVCTSMLIDPGLPQC